jgi:hypothetical protein
MARTYSRRTAKDADLRFGRFVLINLFTYFSVAVFGIVVVLLRLLLPLLLLLSITVSNNALPSKWSR